MGSLKEKRVLVTGGGQGLGHAIVEALIDAAAHVAIHYFSSEAGAKSLQQRAKKSGLQAEIFRADLTQSRESESLVNRAAGALGGIDVLINNAGDLVQRRNLDELDDEFWRRTLDINLSSMAFVTRAAAPWLMKAGQSSIVNISSLAGRKGGHPGSLAY